jgi:hypothetical protein
MKRERGILVKLTDTEHAELARRASELGLSMAGYVRLRALYDGEPRTAAQALKNFGKTFGSGRGLVGLPRKASR